jgi:hypothetical protein
MGKTHISMNGISESVSLEKNISVGELLREHMKFMATRAAFSKESYGPDKKPEDKGDIIAAMENLQCLMNRLNISEPRDPYLDRLAEDRLFLRLSYDSKLLVMEHAARMASLQRSINNLVNILEENPKSKQRIRQSVGWRLFRFFCCIPWFNRRFPVNVL